MFNSWTARSRNDRVLDVIGLTTQGIFVPFLATWFGSALFEVFPESRIALPNWLLFILPFTVVDYIYYWNHRILHLSHFWFSHRVHHTSQRLDIWATSRNSLWTPLFLVYIWFHVGVIVLVKNPQFYIYGLWLMGALDLWRHSGCATPRRLRFLGAILILPEDHEWHHSSEKFGINFGANLNLWDRFHKTFYRPRQKAVQVGSPIRGNLGQELFTPWRIQQ